MYWCVGLYVCWRGWSAICTDSPLEVKLPLQCEALASMGARRIVVVGDLHGDATALREVLREAELISGGAEDDECAWRGGDALLVQLGDVRRSGAREHTF